MEEGWPDQPFAVPIQNVDPDDHCFLSFPTKVGERLATNSETRFFLLEAREQIANLKSQPVGSMPLAFDEGKYDVRFKMEVIPQHPLSLELACAAIEIMYNSVMEGGVREFRALVVCQEVVLGRFRTWFLDPEIESGAMSLNATTSFQRRRH